MQFRFAAITAGGLLLAAGSASAEIKSTWEDGLRTETKVVIAAPPEKVYAALGEIGGWWNGAHTYSGDSSNLTIALKPGGCFCEALPGGGVKHGEVILAWPGTTLRIRGGFGPLQDEGASGALTFNLKKVEGGTEVTQTYAIGGLRPDMVKAAPLFDGVISEQLFRFKSYVETGKPGK